MAVTFIIAVVLSIVFMLFANIGMARLAKYDDIFEAVNLSKVFKDLKKIGIAKSIGWLIVLMIAGFIIILAGVGISMIIPFAVQLLLHLLLYLISIYFITDVSVYYIQIYKPFIFLSKI